MRIIALLALLGLLVAPAMAQTPQAPPSCEDQRDGALTGYGQAIAEAAQLRTQLRQRETALSAANRKIAELQKQAAEKKGEEKK